MARSGGYIAGPALAGWLLLSLEFDERFHHHRLDQLRRLFADSTLAGDAPKGCGANVPSRFMPQHIKNAFAMAGKHRLFG